VGRKKKGILEVSIASKTRRFLAFILDIFLLNLVIVTPFQNIFEKLLGQISILDLLTQEVLSAIFPILFFAVLFSFSYFTLMEYAIGQTVGKIIFNIRISSLKKELGLFQCVVRNLFLIPIFPLSLLIIIDPVFLFFNKKNQRFSEYLSKTIVTG